MSDPFWKKGLRFKCQGCGKCCQARGTYGYVYVTAKDRKRLSEHLEISQSAFTRRYCSSTNDYYHLNDPDRDCMFYVKGKGCSVYEARPEQCRTWPFWPENLRPKTWTSEIVPFCPGIGRGRLHSAKTIQDAVDRDPVGD